MLDQIVDDILSDILSMLDYESLGIMSLVCERFASKMVIHWNLLGKKDFPTLKSKINNIKEYMEIKTLPLGISYERNSGIYPGDFNDEIILAATKIRTFAVDNDSRHLLYVDENKELYYCYLRGFLPYALDDAIGPILPDVKEIRLDIRDCVISQYSGNIYHLDVIKLKYDNNIKLEP